MSSNGATKISERVETVSVEVAVEDPVSDVVNLTMFCFSQSIQGSQMQ